MNYINTNCRINNTIAIGGYRSIILLDLMKDYLQLKVKAHDAYINDIV